MLTNIKTLTLVSLVVVGFGLSACETMEGAGRDIQNAGHSVEDAAE
jgi:predicted small secreted protein